MKLTKSQNKYEVPSEAEPVTTPQIEEEDQYQVANIPQYNVVLLDDDDHTYEYVIEMLHQIFGHSRAAAYQMACIVDTEGRVIVCTTSKERAELKQQQIHAYGPDWRLPYSDGSMSAVIELADDIN